MKKNVLFLVAMLGIATTYGQAYVSVSGGYGFEANKKVVGAEISSSGTTALKGSYGAGFQAQLRGGYFFTKRIGAELAVGYLHGEDVTINKNPFVAMKARGRVFGASLSAVFNVTENLYVRVGGVTKIGGRTEVLTNLDLKPMFPASADFQTNMSAKIPYGFIGGAGYRFKLTDKVSFFLEAEYININVERKTSKLHSFSGNYQGREVGIDQKNGFVAGFSRLQTLPLPEATKARVNALAEQITPLLADEYDWSSQKREAAYSSLGVNFGLTYHF